MAGNRKKVCGNMKYAVNHDALTGLYNREKMFRETRRMVDAHKEIRFVLLRFDIDRFRRYNTVFGEKAGDELLLFLAGSIRNIAEHMENCTYGRMVADTFCICEPYDYDTLTRQVRKVHEDLSSRHKDYLLEPTVGAYIIDDPDLSVEEMYIRAFVGSRKCKYQFGSYLGFYDPDQGRREAEEAAIVNGMQHALDQEQFVIYFQPKFDLTDNRDYGAEALVRWKHPKAGLIFPGKFIPVFERNGFISRLDYYVWEHVCRLMGKWYGDGISLSPMTVNISRGSLYNPGLADMFIGLTVKYGIPISLLNLEITESAYISEPELMRTAVQRLRRAGFVTMMDDFGSGYSSLNMLKDIDVDALKLDMQFLANGSLTKKGEIILASVIQMADRLGMPVIAEGVETEEQKKILHRTGCKYGHEFYYEHPIPQQEYEARYIYRVKKK